MKTQAISTKAISRYTGMSTADIDAILALPVEDIFHDNAYMSLLRSLDRDLLEETLPEARAVYEKHLPAFKDELTNDYDINTDPMSPYTLGNWLVGVTRYPETASGILKMHENVPGHIVAGSLATLLDMLDDMPAPADEEWKRAICALAIPMMKI